MGKFRAAPFPPNSKFWQILFTVLSELVFSHFGFKGEGNRSRGIDGKRPIILSRYERYVCYYAYGCLAARRYARRTHDVRGRANRLFSQSTFSPLA